MSQPVVSFVMCAYNAERFISDALESVSKQTFTDFEAIIVNDGSTDRTLDIIETFVARDNRFRVFTTQNSGEAASRNFGNAKARGAFIANIDADDEALPTRLELQLREFEKRPKLGLLGTAFIRMDENGIITGDGQVDTGSKKIRQLLWRRDTFCHSTLMIRRQCLEQIGGYRTFFRWATDYDMILHIPDAWEADNLSDPLCRYRVHVTNMTSGLSDAFKALFSTYAVYCAFQRKFRGADDVDGGSQEWFAEILEQFRIKGKIEKEGQNKLRKMYSFMAACYLRVGDFSRARRFAKLALLGSGIG